MSLYWRSRVLREFNASSVKELLQWMKDQGHSVARTAQLLGVAHATVRDEAKRLRVEFPHNQKPRGRIGFKNHCNTRYFNYGGERVSMHELARRTGIHRTTIKYRIDVLGWAPEKAAKTPLHAMRASA